MFGKAVDAAILCYSLECAPQEACGYIDANSNFIPMRNVASDPLKSFEIASVPDDALAIVHSHPDGPFYPTELDMQQQMATDIPWGICCFSDRHVETFWFGGEDIAPIVGRGFRHGVTDCYALIKDFYHVVHDVELPEFPRSWDWWLTDKELYIDGFPTAGFNEISIDAILPGDVFIATIHAKSANHAGVYLGDGLILHHPAGRMGYDPFRLSVVESGHRYFNLITKVIRHENDNLNRAVGQTVWPKV